MDLALVWYFLLGALLAGYAVLDGFDLGVGILHPLAKTDEERRLLLNSIGPVWDGNEVWLVTAGGALFAAFPEVYASAFSAFYEPLTLLLAALIFRATAIEFRSKRPSKAWRRAWDGAFFAGSLLIALLVGVALGNVAWGLPLDAGHVYRGGPLALLHPYALLTGLTTVALFAMHGAIYLAMKTEGELQARVRGWIPPAIGLFGALYALATMATLLYAPHLAQVYREHPPLFALPVAALAAVAAVPREVHAGREGRAFVFSSTAIALLLLVLAAGLFPAMLPDRQGLHTLTLWNGSSSPATLKTMLVFAGIGMPLVVGYTAVVYWVFRGKVRLDGSSY